MKTYLYIIIILFTLCTINCSNSTKPIESDAEEIIYNLETKVWDWKIYSYPDEKYISAEYDLNSLPSPYRELIIEVDTNYHIDIVIIHVAKNGEYNVNFELPCTVNFPNSESSTQFELFRFYKFDSKKWESNIQMRKTFFKKTDLAYYNIENDGKFILKIKKTKTKH